MSTAPTLPVPFVDGFFDRPALRALGRSRASAFAAAAPYPHAVFDDFLPADAFAALAAAFPAPSHPGWKRRDYDEQRARLGRLERDGFAGVDPALRHLLAELNGMAFLDFLEALTGTSGLVPDPHFTGGGLASTLPGGHLAMHVDFTRDRRRGLARVLTALYYVHPTWSPTWDGVLHLEREGHGAAAIEPRPNRLVVLANREDGYHGHPAPYAAPEGHARNVALTYYYRVEGSDADARSAIFRL